MDTLHYLDDSELECLVAECENELVQLPQTVKSALIASVHREELWTDTPLLQPKVRWMDSILAHNLRVASVMVACIALLIFLPGSPTDGILEKKQMYGREPKQYSYDSETNVFFDQGVLFTKESNVLFRQGWNQIFVREDITK